MFVMAEPPLCRRLAPRLFPCPGTGSLRRDAIAQQAITLEGIYKIMVNFDCVYNIISDEEKRAVVTALIKEIELYRNDESEYPLKRIGLNFPVFKDGKEVSELL